ncbi:aminoglycoside adenylyltransferase domain-containing protein [Brevibacterium sediminis]|uniref:aminoglycoside adenylyltransferase domain-containing protein n=1 Tax=Brevibacterium sediminis TaxID=1857024 RepID=UPI003B3B806F
MTNFPALDDVDDRSLGQIRNHLTEHDPGKVLGLYLYGSTVADERGPDSDLDLLLITRDSLSQTERRELTNLLLELSGWGGHADIHPEAVGRRPIELTSFATGGERTVAPYEGHDFQYGEWLRTELLIGARPQPQKDRDAPILLATAQYNHQRLAGAELDSLIATVPDEILRHAMSSVIPTLLDEVDGDERNVLLTLARIAVTTDSGRFVSKGRAAELTAARLTSTSAATLLLARTESLGEVHVDWAARHEAVLQTIGELVELTPSSSAP